jgi:hypothetical protein
MGKRKVKIRDARKQPDPEPRWPALVAVLAVAGLYAALPGSLAIGPRWLVPLIVCVLAVPVVLTHHRGYHQANMVLGHLLAAVLTLFMLWSLALLVAALPAHTEPPVMLLRSAAALWPTNVLVFALWYWRLDAGGPHERSLRGAHTCGAFLFPQMTLHPQGDDEKLDDEARSWSPRFIDYVFLAFNTSTALSPTDTPVLSRWAKTLVMVQAMISLTVVVILAARAVNMM